MGTRREASEEKAPREFAFTRKRIEDLPIPAAGRVEYRDIESPELSLRVSSSGVKSFSAHFWVPAEHKKERVTIGKHPGVSVDTARRRLAELLGKVATGSNPAKEKRQYLSQGTLGEAFEAYAKNRRASGRRAVDAMVQQFERWLGKLPEAPKARHAPHERRKPSGSVDWSERRIGTITSAECIALHRAIVNAGRPTSANRVQEILRAAFNFAGITPNPAASAGRGNQHGIERAKQQPRRRFLSREELPLFLKAIAKLEPEEWRDFFGLLLYVGFRRSAVAAMRWADLDLKAGTWQVPEEQSKSGESIVLPIAGPAAEILARRLKARAKGVAYVFPAESKSGHIENPKKAWARVLTECGLGDLHMHDLRRTLGSWLADQNFSTLVIARTLGHKDPRSALVYTWVQTDAARKAVESAHAAFKQAAKAKR